MTSQPAPQVTDAIRQAAATTGVNLIATAQLESGLNPTARAPRRAPISAASSHPDSNATALFPAPRPRIAPSCVAEAGSTRASRLRARPAYPVLPRVPPKAPDTADITQVLAAAAAQTE